MRHSSQTSPTQPKTNWDLFRWLTGLTLLGGLVWAPRTALLFYALCAGTPVEMGEADLNQDGYVSVTEAGYACNVGERAFEREGHRCTEYYSRADWRPIKEVCD